MSTLAATRRVLPEFYVSVTPTTAQPWTPLFAVVAAVAAVVTDTGWMLSHCATVARAYWMPTVIGTGIATTCIVDGELIEVDGDQGVVRIVGDGRAVQRHMVTQMVGERSGGWFYPSPSARTIAGMM